ncbi:hypothetical protein PtA15_16A134 [Puccinia triticina]|uniref:Uncharacterized protein n=1 Tax=Puccinia triticina TaxID=208348 RepID=A0ABY7D3N5_9BASI|nr:uncharacterized protein PtA15_16A134 [Puccinia triticina]WAQ92228.1 hypothetical protein PtA15_16A134 [Puccinia triticina]
MNKQESGGNREINGEKMESYAGPRACEQPLVASPGAGTFLARQREVCFLAAQEHPVNDFSTISPSHREVNPQKAVGWKASGQTTNSANSGHIEKSSTRFQRQAPPANIDIPAPMLDVEWTGDRASSSFSNSEEEDPSADLIPRLRREMRQGRKAPKRTLLPNRKETSVASNSFADSAARSVKSTGSARVLENDVDRSYPPIYPQEKLGNIQDAGRISQIHEFSKEERLASLNLFQNEEKAEVFLAIKEAEPGTCLRQQIGPEVLEATLAHTG